MEAGLDSLGAVELQNQLEIAFNRKLPATIIIDYPNLDALATFMNSTIPRASENIKPTYLPSTASHVVLQEIESILNEMLGLTVHVDEVRQGTITRTYCCMF